MAEYIINVVTKETKKIVIDDVKGITEDTFAQYIAGTKKINNIKKSVTTEIISVDGIEIRDGYILIGKHYNELTVDEHSCLEDLELAACNKCKIICYEEDMIYLRFYNGIYLSKEKIDNLIEQGYPVLCENCCKEFSQKIKK